MAFPFDILGASQGGDPDEYSRQFARLQDLANQNSVRTPNMEVWEGSPPGSFSSLTGGTQDPTTTTRSAILRNAVSKGSPLFKSSGATTSSRPPSGGPNSPLLKRGQWRSGMGEQVTPPTPDFDPMVNQIRNAASGGRGSIFDSPLTAPLTDAQRQSMRQAGLNDAQMEVLRNAARNQEQGVTGPGMDEDLTPELDADIRAAMRERILNRGATAATAIRDRINAMLGAEDAAEREAVFGGRKGYAGGQEVRSSAGGGRPTGYSEPSVPSGYRSGPFGPVDPEEYPRIDVMESMQGGKPLGEFAGEPTWADVLGPKSPFGGALLGGGLTALEKAGEAYQRGEGLGGIVGSGAKWGIPMTAGLFAASKTPYLSAALGPAGGGLAGMSMGSDIEHMFRDPNRNSTAWTGGTLGALGGLGAAIAAPGVALPVAAGWGLGKAIRPWVEHSALDEGVFNVMDWMRRKATGGEADLPANQPRFMDRNAQIGQRVRDSVGTGLVGTLIEANSKGKGGAYSNVIGKKVADLKTAGFTDQEIASMFASAYAKARGGGTYGRDEFDLRKTLGPPDAGGLAFPGLE